jgi:hypothetical protein
MKNVQQREVQEVQDPSVLMLIKVSLGAWWIMKLANDCPEVVQGHLDLCEV